MKTKKQSEEKKNTERQAFIGFYPQAFSQIETIDAWKILNTFCSQNLIGLSSFVFAMT